MGWVLPLDKICPESGIGNLIRHLIVGRENARSLGFARDDKGWREDGCLILIISGIPGLRT
jgi:hypothetical protein